MQVGSYNAVGKTFMCAIGNYADLCCSDADQHRYFNTDTSTGHVQPGAFFLKWKLYSPVCTRQGEEKEITHRHERYTDGDT